MTDGGSELSRGVNMATNVITVTRQFGSMGRPIARMIAEKMGYAYYDRDIIDEVAVRSSIPIDKYLQMSEKPLTGYDKMIYPLGIGDAAKQDRIFSAEKEVILKLADKQNCVIVGRCSDYIMKTASKQNVFSVFIYAPYEARERFCQTELGILPDKVQDYIIRVDRGRAQYYKRQTGEEFMSQKYRNMMIDSSAFSSEAVVDLICQAAENYFS